ncbi:MAG: NADH-quinone oxidoreductase subunit NuoH [Dehalococcoidales bacterium]|nr:NADH-quinone oxidoreductase subunit NuoH [Dehalococcoidales bacterium]
MLQNPFNSALSYTATAVSPDWPGNFWAHWIVWSIFIIVFILMFVMGFIWFERRAMGRMQARLGPNRAGPFGLLQPVADALKVLIKEDIIPAFADKPVHFLAPIVTFVPAMMIFAVIPFQNGALLADLNIGVLYIAAISSVSSIGIFMAGWGSNNKYTLLSAMRNVASVVSYEIPVILSLASVVLVVGSISLNDIVLAQNIPFILMQPLAFLIFFMASSAEINRAPFDLLEADSEIVAGFHTEYSGMKFALFYLVEYAEALAMAAIVSTVFLSGWRGPLLPPWLWLLIKVVAVFFVIVWVRTTVPRVRIDQLMAFSWKFLFPAALINLLITAAQVLFWPEASQWIIVVINIAIMVVLLLAWSRLFKLGWGKVEVGTIR